MVRGPEGAPAAAEALGGFEHGLYAEQWAPYVKVRARVCQFFCRTNTSVLKSCSPGKTVESAGYGYESRENEKTQTTPYRTRCSRLLPSTMLTIVSFN